MTERQLQFRVGLFAVVSLILVGAMVFQFGKLKSYFEPKYMLAVHFSSAPGVYPATPVRKNGVTIGSVSEVRFDERRGGVTVVVAIHRKYRLRADAQPRLVRGLLGDAAIEFSPGISRQALQPGTTVEGIASVSPVQLIEQLEQKLTVTLDSFTATSRQWEQVGRNVNDLLVGNREELDLAIQRAAQSLEQFAITMKTANETLADAGSIIGDPQNQQNLRRTLAALPELVEETRDAVAAVGSAVRKADENLENLSEVTGPLAKRSASIVLKLDATMSNLEALSAEMKRFAQLVNGGDGSLKRFASDPALYRNLNRSATSLSVLLTNLEPVLRDLRVFSDKIARHPELLGVRGAVRGSSGLKDPPDGSPPLRSAAPAERLQRQRR